MERGEDVRIAEAARWAKAMDAVPGLVRRERAAKTMERLAADQAMREELERAAVEKRQAGESSAATRQRIESEVMGEFLRVGRSGWRIEVLGDSGRYKVRLSIPSPEIFSTSSKRYSVEGSDVAELRGKLRVAVDADPPPYPVPKPARMEYPAFITNYRANQIIWAGVDAAHLKRLGIPTHGVYKPGTFEGVFSPGELARLAACRAMFEDFELFFSHLYRKPPPPEHSDKEVGSNRPAAFHLDRKCENLLADYEGYEIPVEVRERGREEIERFRRWCHDNEQLAEEDPDRFQFRAVHEFRLQSNPRIIVRPNSGAFGVDNQDLASLEAEIDGLLDTAQGQLWRSPTIEKFGHLAHIEGLRVGPEAQEELRAWAALKNLLKKKLTIYYQVRFNGELQFDGHLLEQLGFRPCSACAANWKTIGTTK